MSKIVRGINDLATAYPDIAAEWHPEKNGMLTPQDVMPGSDKRIWWKCRMGHEWKTAVYHRKAGHGCPFCTASASTVKKGENDLQSQKPELASEWDAERNYPFTPDGVGTYSQKRFWWICSQGHSWRTTVAHRTRGQGCPVCSGAKLLTGFNDLATTAPMLADEWNYDRNGSLLPTEVMSGTDRKVWWKCVRGHEWEAVIYSRKAGSGCPYCAGNCMIPGENDVRTLYPKVARTWDRKKNHPLVPEMTAYGSAVKVWWKCRKGHSWKAVVSSRTIGGKGCPYCSGTKVLKGFNDLQSLCPERCEEWDYEKNGSVLPDMVTRYSKKKVWWKCPDGHGWLASVADHSLGHGCPYCCGRKVIPGESDLATAYPELADEWNTEKNGVLTPSDVTAGSSRMVWWRCRNGHEWRSQVNGRTGKIKNGCPYCGNRRAWPGYNDLLSVSPELAAQWDYENNDGLKPSEVTYRTTKYYWWRCAEGHSWKASVYYRQKGAGCPYCSGNRVLTGQNDLKAKASWLLEEWDWERNGDLHPEEILPFTNRKAWWKCRNGHHWRSSINSRHKGIGCPYCSGRFASRKHIVP